MKMHHLSKYMVSYDQKSQNTYSYYQINYFSINLIRIIIYINYIVYVSHDVSQSL